MNTHEALRFHELSDLAQAERVRYYCAAIKAAEISNHKAASYFTRRAQKWENLRIVATRKLIEDQSCTA